LWTDVCGKHRWRGALDTVAPDVRRVDDSRLWRLRAAARKCLVEYARKRLARQRASQGANEQQIAEAQRVFDPNTLTLGFARRFAAYKRPNLLLQDPERLLRILTNPERPVQLILAGKAHPQDPAGQAMIRQWHEFMRRPEARSRVVFLSDYDAAAMRSQVFTFLLFVACQIGGGGLLRSLFRNRFPK